MMKVLVTGGAGFIGSHLIERLLASGHTVTCLDNFFTGTIENVTPFIGNRAFELCQQDVIERYRGRRVEQVYNLACPASPQHYRRDPTRTMRTNILGALAILDQFARGTRVLQASTSEVYGDPAIHPQTERYNGNVNPIGPRACYNEGKRAVETIFFDYHRQYATEIKIARIFNTYGPRMRPDDGRVISNFIVQALRNKPLTVYGDGFQTRSFCYVSDLVSGLILLMNSPKEITGPINLGNPYEVTVRDLAATVIKVVGSRSKIKYLEAVQDDPYRRQPDITLAAETLEWAPTVDLITGLNATVVYFETLLMTGATANG